MPVGPQTCRCTLNPERSVIISMVIMYLADLTNNYGNYVVCLIGVAVASRVGTQASTNVMANIATIFFNDLDEHVTGM